MSGGNWETDFVVHCSQCGGEDFVEIFPVPARVCRVYDGNAHRTAGHELVASAYACQQCGHVEWFVDPGMWGGNAPRPDPDHGSLS